MQLTEAGRQLLWVSRLQHYVTELTPSCFSRRKHWWCVGGFKEPPCRVTCRVWTNTWVRLEHSLSWLSTSPPPARQTPTGRVCSKVKPVCHGKLWVRPDPVYVVRCSFCWCPAVFRAVITSKLSAECDPRVYACVCMCYVRMSQGVYVSSDLFTFICPFTAEICWHHQLVYRPEWQKTSEIYFVPCVNRQSSQCLVLKRAIFALAMQNCLCDWSP